jgi:tetratricopeptide (TPR) repeat protein
VTRSFAFLLLTLLAAAPTRAHADDDESNLRGPCIDMRKAYAAGDYESAREFALDCYALVPTPQLLFALGQIEFNLHHYKEAIDYYEKFKATNPPADQAALAEQGIGAARAELDRPPPQPPQPPQPPKPVPPPHREFDTLDTALAVSGAAALAGSVVLFYEAGHLSDNHNGSLAAYSQRIDHAVLVRDVGFGAAAGGALVLGAALLRWRLHLVETTVTVDASATGATITLVHAL